MAQASPGDATATQVPPELCLPGRQTPGTGFPPITCGTARALCPVLVTRGTAGQCSVAALGPEPRLLTWPLVGLQDRVPLLRRPSAVVTSCLTAPPPSTLV